MELADSLGKFVVIAIAFCLLSLKDNNIPYNFYKSGAFKDAEKLPTSVGISWAVVRAQEWGKLKFGGDGETDLSRI